MGRTADGEHEILEHSIQQRWESLSLRTTSSLPCGSTHAPGLTNKCKEGNNCRFAHCNQEFDFAERLLRAWGHEFPHEAGALIKVYREALLNSHSESATAEYSGEMQARPEVAVHESISSASSPTDSGRATWCTSKNDSGRSATGTQSGAPESGSL